MKLRDEWPRARRILQVRCMTDAELAREGWSGFSGVAVDLDDGSSLYCSKDSEGNGPGVLFAVDADGNAIHVQPEEARS